MMVPTDDAAITKGIRYVAPLTAMPFQTPLSCSFGKRTSMAVHARGFFERSPSRSLMSRSVEQMYPRALRLFDEQVDQIAQWHAERFTGSRGNCNRQACIHTG